MRTSRWIYAIMAVGAAGGWWYWMKSRRMSRPYISKEIAEKLPQAKNLNTVSDHSGNYDIDGVSFDSTGVVVSSDNLTANPLDGFVGSAR